MRTQTWQLAAKCLAWSVAEEVWRMWHGIGLDRAWAHIGCSDQRVSLPPHGLQEPLSYDLLTHCPYTVLERDLKSCHLAQPGIMADTAW